MSIGRLRRNVTKPNIVVKPHRMFKYMHTAERRRVLAKVNELGHAADREEPAPVTGAASFIGTDQP